MIFSIRSIFEVHLSVADRRRSVRFFQDVLNFELAADFEQRDISFLWMGPRGSRMLGLWGSACPDPPISRGHSHFAMELPLEEVKRSIDTLRAKGVTPRDFDNNPTTEPVVLAWMPAASVYFDDPDGHSLEFISMLNDSPQPQLGILRLSEWESKR